MEPGVVAIVFLAVLAVVGAAVGLMLVSQRLSGRCLRGSCGGSGGCPECPNRARAE